MFPCNPPSGPLRYKTSCHTQWYLTSPKTRANHRRLEKKSQCQTKTWDKSRATQDQLCSEEGGVSVLNHLTCVWFRRTLVTETFIYKIFTKMDQSILGFTHKGQSCLDGKRTWSTGRFNGTSHFNSNKDGVANDHQCEKSFKELMFPQSRSLFMNFPCHFVRRTFNMRII